MSQQPRVTLIVVPRERFSFTEKSLENIYANTQTPFDLIYVDCNSPLKIKTYLEAKARECGFNLIRSNRFLTPNQARNLALPQVNTEYVVFIDNDVLVKPGWLGSLVQCADETGAWVVGPLCLEGEDFQKVHMAGGSFSIKEREGKQFIAMRRPYFRTPLTKVREEFKRQACDLFEFHCCLARTDVFDKIGLLDESILSLGMEEDFSLAVLQAGGSVFFEPSAVMTYVPPEKLDISDIPFFFVHWSKDWGDISLDYLQGKWNIHEFSPLIRGFKVFVKGQKYTICKKPSNLADDLLYPMKKSGLKVAEAIFNQRATLLSNQIG